MTYFKGKVALITGSSSGIGAATAVLFASKGAHVCVTGRNVESLKQIEEKCLAHGVKVVSKTGDVADTEHLKHLVHLTESTLGPIDILVNNVGLIASTDLSLTTGSIEHYDLTMNVNLRSVVILTKLCIGSLKQTQGCVVNISSVGSVQITPSFMFYDLSKASIDYFTKAAAIELAPFKIRVNGINPGGVRTTIAEKVGLNKAESEKMFDGMALKHPLGRVGNTEELAQAILYLTGENAQFITGTSLFIDGGLSKATSTPTRTESIIDRAKH